MLCGGFGYLIGAREMDIAVLPVDGRTAEHAFAFGIVPQRGRTNFVNYRHQSMAMPLARL
jgi:hypothetical protein